MNAFGPEWEAGIARTHQGSADRRDELMALGNAIAPQIAFVILQAMLEADEAVQP